MPHIHEDIIDVVSLGPKFSINEKINKNDIIDTLKNLEISLENSDLPTSKQSEIREKVVSNLRTGFNQQ